MPVNWQGEKTEKNLINGETGVASETRGRSFCLTVTLLCETRKPKP